jgi:hypothetical protein
LPCCNNSEKGSLEFWKNQNKNGIMFGSERMYMKINDTYFNWNKWIFCTTVYSYFALLIKGNVEQLFLELVLTIIFH